MSERKKLSEAMTKAQNARIKAAGSVVQPGMTFRGVNAYGQPVGDCGEARHAELKTRAERLEQERRAVAVPEVINEWRAERDDLRAQGQEYRAGMQNLVAGLVGGSRWSPEARRGLWIGLVIALGIVVVGLSNGWAGLR